MNWFDRANQWLEGVEGSIITFVTMLIPWLAPALPAWLTFSHLTGEIGIPSVVAGAMAASVEFLGLAAIATAFAAMRHNRMDAAQKRKVSLSFPVIAYVFYVCVVLTVNVVLSLPIGEDLRPYVHAGVIALLTLISAPAFVIAVARQDQREMEQAARDAKGGRVQAVQSPVQVHVQQRATYEQFAIAQMARGDAKAMSPQDIQAHFGVSRRTAYNWLERYREEKAREEL